MNYTQREKLVDKLCGAALMLICFEIYYQAVASAYMDFNYSFGNVTNGVYITGGVILAIAIAVLIYAYLKKDGYKGVYGIETLVLAITAVTLPGTYLTYHAPFNLLNKIYPWVALVYFVGKAVYIVLDANKKANVGKKKAKKKR